MQIIKNWYGGQLDASLDSGSENFLCLILTVGTRIVHIHTVLEGFAYPCETGYADFVRVYGTTHLK